MLASNVSRPFALCNGCVFDVDAFSICRYDLATGASKVLGNHEAGIKCMEYVKATGQVVTGSWDKSVKLWDARAPTSLVSTLSQPDKVFTLDLSEHKLIVGTAGRHVVRG